MKKKECRNMVFCRLKQQIKERKSLFILLFILQMLGIPVITITMRILCSNPQYLSENTRVFLLIPCLLFSLASVSGIYCALSSFRYLQNKCRADSVLSVPMTATQRFIGDFLSGLIIYVIPYIAAASASLLTVAFSSKADQRLHMPQDPTISGIILRAFIRFFRNDITEVTYILFSGLLIMLMLYTLTSFVSVCCGNKIECISYTIIINVFIPVFAFISTASPKYSSIWTFYLHDKMNYWSVDVLSSTSPFGGLTMLINRIKSRYNCEHIIPTPSYWTIKYVFVILIIFTLTFLLYKKRKAEDISKPFVFSSVYYCFIVLITMSVFAFAYKLEMSFLSFLLSLVVFLILDVIKNRGVKKNRKIKTAVLYTASIAMSFLLIEAYDAYHINDIKKIPDRSDIRSVTLTLPMKYHYYNTCYTGYSTLVTFSDTENIETTLDMHRKAIENKDKAGDLSIEIMYTMKNGVKKYRDIFVESSFYYKKSDEYVNNKKTPEVLAYTILSAFKKYDKTMAVIQAPSSYYVPDELLDLSNEQLNELSESLANDIHNTAINDIPITETFCEINSCYYIPVEYTNTISLFKKYGLIRK